MESEVATDSLGYVHLLLAVATRISQVGNLDFLADLRAGREQPPGTREGADMKAVAAVAVSSVGALSNLYIVVSSFGGDHLAG